MTDLLTSGQIAHLQAILAHWDIPPATSIVSLDEKNPVFKITTSGPTFILKDISHAPNLTRLAFTRDVLTHVARTGLRVPLPLLSRSAQLAFPAAGQFYLLSEFIEAGEYPKPEQMGELFFATGQAIATLHQALATYPDAAVSQKTWRQALAEQVAEWISVLGAGLPEAESTVVQRVGQKRGVAIEAGLRGLPEQLIHRDCHPGNILVQGTRVISFIDWEDLCIGPRLFDLAYYAAHHLKLVMGDAVATRRWLTNLPHLLTGYRSVQRLSPAEMAAFPYAMLAYHLLLAHWFMGLQRPESIVREVRALDWIDRHFDTIVNASIVH